MSYDPVIPIPTPPDGKTGGISFEALAPILGECNQPYPEAATDIKETTSKFGMAAEEPDTLYL